MLKVGLEMGGETFGDMMGGEVVGGRRMNGRMNGEALQELRCRIGQSQSQSLSGGFVYLFV